MILRKALFRLWFHLTYSIHCSWCKGVIHRALIPLPSKRLTNSIRLPRVSHGICPACFGRMVVK
jgi:hypothetical protein